VKSTKVIGGILVSVGPLLAYFCNPIPTPRIGMGIAMLCFAGIGFLHRSLDEASSTLLRRWIRLYVRILFAIFFATFPLIPSNDALLDLGLNTLLLALVVISETIGKISIRDPSSANLEYGTSSREQTVKAAGFDFEDLTPYEK
jgi:hypothetical protein